MTFIDFLGLQCYLLDDFIFMTMADQEVDLTQQEEEEPKWDYTTSRDAQIAGAAVLIANFLVLILFFLYKYVPAVHQFISGRPN